MPRPGPRRQQVAVRLSAEQIAALDAEAERQGVDRSEVVRQAVDTFQGERRIEWGVRRLRGDVGSVAGPLPRSEAEEIVKAWSGEIVSRVVTVSPWLSPRT